MASRLHACRVSHHVPTSIPGIAPYFLLKASQKKKVGSSKTTERVVRSFPRVPTHGPLISRVRNPSWNSNQLCNGRVIHDFSLVPRTSPWPGGAFSGRIRGKALNLGCVGGVIRLWLYFSFCRDSFGYFLTFWFRWLDEWRGWQIELQKKFPVSVATLV